MSSAQTVEEILEVVRDALEDEPDIYNANLEGEDSVGVETTDGDFFKVTVYAIAGDDDE